MKDTWRILLVALIVCTSVAFPQATTPTPAPEFTHHRDSDWVNSTPLTLTALRGKVVLVEFWAFECVNCLNSSAWVEQVERDKGAAGLVVVGVHTPELPQEKSESKVREAVQRLGIHHPVMLDTDYSYWHKLNNQYWPGFYLIGRDGKLYGHAYGEMHVGQDSAKRVEQALDLLLAAAPPS
jgi:thiol-disulfide isomerase/thioredoxin